MPTDRFGQTAWAELVRAEEAARAKVSPGDPDRLREWWAAVSAILHALTIGAADSAGRPATLPGELALVLSRITGALAVGTINAMITDAGAEGAPRAGPIEARDLSLAAAYRRACSPTGLTYRGTTVRIEDKTPIATLVRWFGVERSTVQGWVKRYPTILFGPSSISRRSLVRLTQAAGERYRLAGRSTVAISARGRRV